MIDDSAEKGVEDVLIVPCQKWNRTIVYLKIVKISGVAHAFSEVYMNSYRKTQNTFLCFFNKLTQRFFFSATWCEYNKRNEFFTKPATDNPDLKAWADKPDVLDKNT